MTKDKSKLIIKKTPSGTGKYLIKIEGKIIWEGTDLQTQFPEIFLGNRGKNLSIGFKRESEKSLIV